MRSEVLTFGVLAASEESLLARIKRGDPDAMGEIYDEHHGALCSFATRLLADDHAAEDRSHCFVCEPRSRRLPPRARASLSRLEPDRGARGVGRLPRAVSDGNVRAGGAHRAVALARTGKRRDAERALDSIAGDEADDYGRTRANSLREALGDRYRL